LTAHDNAGALQVLRGGHPVDLEGCGELVDRSAGLVLLDQLTNLSGRQLAMVVL